MRLKFPTRIPVGCRCPGIAGLFCGSLLATVSPNQLQAGAVITEFLASNVSGLADEDGERPDWVEIHNPDPTPYSLDGSYLTDNAKNLEKWRLPDVTLQPDEYLVVFASRKNRAVAGSELHASFALSRTGEYLALVNSDGRTIASEFAPQFPAQFADVSYGTTESGNVPEGFFDRPTPGAANGRAKLSAGTVQFARPSQAFTRNFRIALSLTSTVPGATIRYTTDGSLPHAGSPEFGVVIAITRTMQVRARAFASGALDGPVRTETYFKLASDLESFTSDIPLVVIDSLGSGIPPESGATNFKTMVMAVFEPKEDGRSSLLNAPDLISRVGVRKRGSSTAGWPKYSMRLETWDDFSEDREVEPFGMPPESDWVLSGRYEFDRALIRNPFMYALSNQIGRYAARTKLVEVIHDSDTDDVLAYSDYFGVYTFMEQIKRDPNRVNIEELNAGDAVEPEVTGGYILKIDRSDPGGGSFSAGGQGLQYNEPDADVITPRQKAYLTNYINEMAPALARSDPRNGYQAYIDSGAWIDEHILRTLSKDPDGLRLSTYLHKHRGAKLAFGPVWDFDRTIGCDSDGRAFDPNSWAPIDYFFTQAWWNTLLGTSARDGGAGNNPDFWQEYKDRWHELRQGPMSIANMNALVDELAGQIREAQARNFVRWGPKPNGGQFAGSLGGWEGEVEHMKGWLAARVRWIDSKFLVSPVFNQHGGAVPEGFGLAITSNGGSVIYTTDGSDPRASGGARAAGSRRFAATRTTTNYVQSAAACKYLVPPDGSLGTTWTGETFADAAWPDGTSGLGWKATTPPFPLLNTDLESVARGFNASVYTRFRFDFANNPQNIITATLKMKYDDGFVAYVNGVEVASSNNPAGLTWNSAATDRQSDEAVEVFELFDITNFKNSFVDGPNVLAIHALNSSSSGSDMFVLPELEITEAIVSNPILLSETVEVTARTYNGTVWSAPTGATFVVGAVPADATNLAITEIMYRPERESSGEAARGFNDRDLFEFVELMNIGPRRVDLRGASFSAGILFDFATSAIISLEPGERVLVVRNQAAFEIRYGNGWSDRIAGEFAAGTGLQNDGETIFLGAEGGAPIREFTYGAVAPWPEAAGIDGFSLILIDPSSNPDHADPANWRASTRLGGSPGAADPVPFSGDPGADLDLDGLSALMEYGLGSDDRDPLSGPGLVGTHLAGGELLFSFQRNEASVDLFYEIDVSEELATWVSGDGVVEFVSEVPNGDGTATVTYRVVDPRAATLYLRLRVSLRPPAGSLVISEIMYRPPVLSAAEITAGFTDRDDFEFLELTNIGASPIDLSDVTFVDGVTFDFADGAITSLNPGDRLLVVSNADAFELRYGSGLSGLVAGPFTGGTNLSNGGEALRLVGAGGEVIRDFTYNDLPPWPVAADGDGFSLVLIAPLTNPDHGDPASWRASTAVGGNPGTSDRVTFTGDADADQDSDLLSAFFEHALGSNDSDPTSGPGSYTISVARLEVEGVLPGDYLLLSYRRNLAADDVIHIVEATSDLQTWNSGPGIVEFLSEVHQGDGTSLVTYRSAMPVTSGAEEFFMRLRVAGR